MVRYWFLETKQRHVYRRYGGQVIHFCDDISCLQCGASHTEEGELVSTHSVQELQALVTLEEIILLKAEITK